MDIHILHDGQQTGPFTEEAVQAMLKQGDILINDLAWRSGMEKWLPLHAVLYPAGQSASTPPPPPPEALRPPPTSVMPAESAPAAAPVKTESASPRQKAFLTYLGIPFPNELAKDKAALLVNDAMEDPKNAARIKKWDEERMRLYPDIFADEIKAKRDSRAQFFLEVCQREGAEFFEGVTKAHTQLLVGYLDVQYPNWDQQEHSAKFDYFFPALSEKFPQVLKKGVKGRFKYPDGPRVAAELVRRPVAVRTSPASSAVGAMFRGVFFGAIVLGMLWVAYQLGTGKLKLPESFARTGATPAATEKKSEPTPAVFAKTGDPTPAPKPVVRATPAPAPVAGVNPAVPGPLDPAPAVAANNAEMANPGAPNSPLPSGVSLFDTTPPPATPPAAVDPLVPATPPPAQAIIAKVNKPTTVMLKFGSSSIRQGTPVQIITVEGAFTKIRFGPDVVSVPTANLDLPETAAPATPAVPVVPPPPPQ